MSICISTCPCCVDMMEASTFTCPLCSICFHFWYQNHIGYVMRFDCYTCCRDVHRVHWTLHSTHTFGQCREMGKCLFAMHQSLFAPFFVPLYSSCTYHIVIELALISHFPSNMDGTASALLLCHLQLPLFSHVAHVWNWFCTRSTHLLAYELQFMLVWW